MLFFTRANKWIDLRNQTVARMAGPIDPPALMDHCVTVWKKRKLDLSTILIRGWSPLMWVLRSCQCLPVNSILCELVWSEMGSPAHLPQSPVQQIGLVFMATTFDRFCEAFSISQNPHSSSSTPSQNLSQLLQNTEVLSQLVRGARKTSLLVLFPRQLFHGILQRQTNELC